jgi:hypothetical protein
MKRLLLLLPVFLIVLTSGCTIPGLDNLIGTGPVYESDVVVIRSMQAYPSVIRTGEQMRLVTYVQNTGDKTVPASDAENIKVTLYDHCTGLFDESSITPNCPDGNNEGKTVCNVKQLLPGETKEMDWTLFPNPTKIATPCELKVSVTYPYTTNGLSTISFVEPKEYQRQLEQGSFSAKAHYTAKGQGPVKAFFSVKDQEPIPAAEGFTSVSLDFHNMGYGFLANPGPATGTVTGPRILAESVTMKVPEELLPVKDCEYGKDSELKPDEDVKLIKNKRSLPCKLTIPTDVDKETTYQLEVSATYLYEFRQKTKVTVNPGL